MPVGGTGLKIAGVCDKKVKPSLNNQASYFHKVIVDGGSHDTPAERPTRRAGTSGADDGGTSGYVFEVRAPNVSMSCVSTRHGDRGFFFTEEAINSKLSRVSAVRANTGAYIDGKGFDISRSLFIDGNSAPLDIDNVLNDPAKRGRLVGNLARHGDGCFEIDGDNIDIDKNIAHLCGDSDDGFNTDSGNNLNFTNNVALEIDGEGFLRSGLEQYLRRQPRHPSRGCWLRASRRRPGRAEQPRRHGPRSRLLPD